MSRESELAFQTPDAFRVARRPEAVSASSRLPDFFAERATKPATSSAVPTRRPRAGSSPQPTVVLNQFEFNTADLRAFHLPVIEHVARYVVGRAGNRRVVSVVHLVGHGDGNEQNSEGLEIGQRRAVAAERNLVNAIERLWPGLNERIRYVTQSRGAQRPAASNRTPAGQALNRRVEVFVYLNPARSPVQFPLMRRNTTLRQYEWGEATSIPDIECRQPEQKACNNERGALSLDGLSHVSSSTDPTNRSICFLQMDFGEDPRSLSLPGQRITIAGAGVLIGPRHVLTAGQCLFSRSRMHPVSRMTPHGPVTELLPIKCLCVLVASGGDGDTVEPPASASVTDSKFLRINERWEASRATNAGFNFGLITLEKPLTADAEFWGSAGNQVFPLIDAELQGSVVQTVAYPAHTYNPNSVGSPCLEKRQGKTQRSMVGKISGIATHTFTHDLPTSCGQSGSPIWIEQGGDRLLVGISTIGQQAVRITFDLLCQLREWMAKDGA
jgi:outer membrane protein OmpA-like peptidoglycan-associated protein